MKPAEVHTLLEVKVVVSESLSKISTLLDIITNWYVVRASRIAAAMIASYTERPRPRLTIFASAYQGVG